MALLPSTLSPRWLLALVVTAVFWTAAAMLAAYINTGRPPTLENLQGAALMLSMIAAVPALLGFLGARLGFVCAHLGLLIGYVLMLGTFGAPTEGFRDLAAVAMFLMLGVIGLGVGLVVDIVRYFVGRKGASSAA